MNYYLGPYEWVDNTWTPPVGTTGSIDLRNLTDMGTPVVPNGAAFFATPNTLGTGYDLLGQGDLRDINATNAMKSAWDSLLGYRPKGIKLVDLLYDHLTAGSDPTGVDRARPLMPVRNKLTIHLHGPSPVKSTEFRFGNSPNRDKVISVLQEDYREIRRLVQDGKLPVDHHRRVLDFWGKQYGIKNPQLIFIPNNLPIETPLPHSTTLSEDFDGADNAIVGKQLTWDEPGGGSFWDNFNNHARKLKELGTEDEKSIRATSVLSGLDQRCIVTNIVQNNLNRTIGGPICRYSSSAVTFYRWDLARQSSSDSTRILKVITGTGTTIKASRIVTAPPPNTLKFEIIGSRLVTFLNNIPIEYITDTSITTNLFCGIFGERTETEDIIEFDDWSAEDIIMFSGDHPAMLMELL